MITKVEAFNYRCLRLAGHTLDRFNVLVGPNASGKTTFLDVISFLGDVVSVGPETAIAKRTEQVNDMFTGGVGEHFEMAIEAQLPDDIRRVLAESQREEAEMEDYVSIRYMIRVGLSAESGEAGILGERVVLRGIEFEMDSGLFAGIPEKVYFSGRARNARNVVHKVEGHNDNFYSEVYPNKGKGWLPSFKFGLRKSALGNLPDDGRRFPASTWLKELLTGGITQLILNSRVIRIPSAPGQPKRLLPEGSNLPWVVDRLRTEHRPDFDQWLAHVQTALPDIIDVNTILREEDRHRYLVVNYADGNRVPSWFVSDGTLRFLALTLLAYLPDSGTTYLVEEPENGLHPPVIDPLFQSFKSMYNSQMLIATHSPIALGLVDTADILCFRRLASGTEIIAGNRHPALREWKGEINLGTLIASGILG
jgi:predicted ATPase